MRIPSWPWNSGPALYPRRVVGGGMEFAHPAYMCFVDLAYDHVPRGILWGVLREYGVPGPLVRAIRSMYEQSASCVRILSTKSSTLGVGLRQGCPLSQFCS